ncbi:hypothetical protein IAT38_000393 [Cryptococcus sp. DSM 104549]
MGQSHGWLQDHEADDSMSKFISRDMGDLVKRRTDSVVNVDNYGRLRLDKKAKAIEGRVRQWGLLSALADHLRTVDPEASCRAEGGETDEADATRLFMAPGFSKRAFPRYLRPVLGVHVTSTESPVRHVLVLACACDAAGDMIPLAWGVSTGEHSLSTMKWFFQELGQAYPCLVDMGPGGREGKKEFLLVSDLSDAITEAVEELLPNVYSSGYIENICAQIKSQKCFGIRCVNLFKKLAWCYPVSHFELYWHKAFAESERTGQIPTDFFEFLNTDKMNPRLWSQAHSPGPRFGLLPSSIMDQADDWAREVKGLPPIHLMDALWSRLGAQVIARGIAAETDEAKRRMFPVEVEKMLEWEEAQSKSFEPYMYCRHPWPTYRDYVHPLLQTTTLCELYREAMPELVMPDLAVDTALANEVRARYGRKRKAEGLESEKGAKRQNQGGRTCSVCGEKGHDKRRHD